MKHSLLWWEELNQNTQHWTSTGVDVSWIALGDEITHEVSEEISNQVQNPIGLLITIRRPQARNALDLNAINSIVEIVNSLSKCVQVSNSFPSAIILTGANGHFVAGGDLKALSRFQNEEIAEDKFSLMADALELLKSFPCPLITAAEGSAVGGGAELLITGDLKVVSESIKVRFAQVSLGLCTGWGGARRLVELIGRQRALALLLGGEILTAERCLNLGLADRVVPQGEVLNCAINWAKQLSLVPQAVHKTKYLLSENLGENDQSDLRIIAMRERQIFPNLWRSDEHWNAVQRFWIKHQNREK